MNSTEFYDKLSAIESDDDFESFCQTQMLQGTPFVFKEREEEFSAFKQKICENFKISHEEVYLVGSGKLGFSPHKKTEFSLDSDIDLAVISSALSDHVGELGLSFEYDLRNSRAFLTVPQKEKYYEYLRYRSIGWMRPDLIPHKLPLIKFKKDWFNFFDSISFGKSEVGNFKVTAGLFKSRRHLNLYTNESFRKIKRKIRVES